MGNNMSAARFRKKNGLSPGRNAIPMTACSGPKSSTATTLPMGITLLASPNRNLRYMAQEDGVVSGDGGEGHL